LNINRNQQGIAYLGFVSIVALFIIMQIGILQSGNIIIGNVIGVIVLLVIIITGMIWAIYSVFYASRRKLVAHEMTDDGTFSNYTKQKFGEPKFIKISRQTFKYLFSLFVIITITRLFLVEHYYVPSGAMMPTLLIGDTILVNKLFL